MSTTESKKEEAKKEVAMCSYYKKEKKPVTAVTATVLNRKITMPTPACPDFAANATISKSNTTICGGL